MRDQPPDILEKHRVRTGSYATTSKQGLCGAFVISVDVLRGHAYGETRCAFVVLSDNGLGIGDAEATHWEHVSVSIQDADGAFADLPTWDDMDRIRQLFWKPPEWVMQLHPARTEKIDHAQALHLFRPLDEEIPKPPSELVGPVTT